MLVKLIPTIILSLLFSSKSFAEIDRTFPLSDDEYFQKINTLNWQYSSPIILDKHDAVIEHSGEFEYLNDANEVNQFQFWISGQEDTFRDLMAFYYYDLENIYKSIQLVGNKFNNDGYVKLDDWKDLKPDDLIRQKKENANINNEKRREIGVDLVENVEWIEYPSLDYNSNSVSYSFKVSWSDGSQNMNKFLIILGRNGFSEFEIVSTYGIEEEFKAARELSYFLQNNFRYNPQFEYKDYKPGDKVAAYGIAALVATSLGVKGLAKAGGILVALKKFWFILLLPFIFLFRLVTGRKNK
tara:strand:+ start:749 stop:1642 length:894 start_codon:yes stop_codon:yes gene_type:complete